MRGPGMRVKYDVRRIWKCPQCGYVRHVPQTAVTVRCHCTSEHPFMKLVEPQRVVRVAAPPLDAYVSLDDFPEEAPVVPSTTEVPPVAEQTVSPPPHPQPSSLNETPPSPPPSEEPHADV